MNRARLAAVVIALIAAVTLVVRLPALGLRPMHCDEAVHALKFDLLWHGGAYRYDPHEYHGPTLYYFTLPVVWASGTADFGSLREATLRLVPVIFGAGVVLLLVLLADGMGRAAAVWAALLTAASPAMTFYSRYYIQEMLLVFFTLALIACGWRYARTGRLGWALAAGAALGLMHATKETFVIAVGAMCAALVATSLWRRSAIGVSAAHAPTKPDPDRIKGEETSGGRACTVSQEEPGPRSSAGGLAGYSATADAARSTSRRPIRAVAVIAGLLVAAVVSMLLYSGMLADPHGIVDSVLTYRTYFERAGAGGAHEHPWDYYLRLLAWTHFGHGPVWSEALILALAAVGAWVALVGGGVHDEAGRVWFGRWLAVYAIVLTVAYGAIPYKTPWCALSFLQALAMLAGMGAAAIVRGAGRVRLRVVTAVVLLAGVGQLGVQARRACSRRWCADYHNPYVYAQPQFAVVHLARRIEELATVVPGGRPLLVKVMADDYWPLPWYLRRLPQVGWWRCVPPAPDADVVVVGDELLARFSATAHDAYQINSYGLRQPSVVLWLGVRRDLWDRYVRQRLMAAPAGSARNRDTP